MFVFKNISVVCLASRESCAIDKAKSVLLSLQDLIGASETEIERIINHDFSDPSGSLLVGSSHVLVNDTIATIYLIAPNIHTSWNDYKNEIFWGKCKERLEQLAKYNQVSIFYNSNYICGKKSLLLSFIKHESEWYSGDNEKLAINNISIKEQEIMVVQNTFLKKRFFVFKHG